jgi:hypothetical protein
MALHFASLDARTREFMLAELEHDLREGTLYLSPRLSARGRADYADLLRAAIEAGDETTLAEGLRQRGRMKAREIRRKRNGKVIVAKVPVSAPAVLAADEFNRFYARGLCCRALAEGIAELIVYRARSARRPRPGSEAVIGARVDPELLLADLRSSVGTAPAFGLPSGPNSGLSVRLP